jgi:hypothetical protein
LAHRTQLFGYDADEADEADEADDADDFLIVYS